MSWPWTISRGPLFSGSCLLFGLSAQVCWSVWRKPWGLRLWSWFWRESYEAGAHSSLFLAWNGEWFWMSLLAECVPSGFLLVCICIFNVHVSSELCRRPFLSQTNKLFTMLHSDSLFIGDTFSFSAAVPVFGGFFCLFVKKLYCLDYSRFLCNTWTSLANVW